MDITMKGEIAAARLMAVPTIPGVTEPTIAMTFIVRNFFRLLRFCM